MKLIVFPLSVLILIAVLAMCGLGNSKFGGVGGFAFGGNSDGGWYDEDSHQVCDANGTATGEGGFLVKSSDIATYWANDTADVWFYNNTGIASGMLTHTMYRVYQQGGMASYFMGFTALTAFGVLAIIVIVMGVVLIIGFHFVGSGESEVGVLTIVKGGTFLGIWGLFSFVAGGLIGSIPIFGAFFWLLLTLLYCLGIIQQIGFGGVSA